MSAPNTTTILYVEDEADDVFFMRNAFKRVGMPPDFPTVADGHEAIEYLAGRSNFADRHRYPLPTVLLLDLNLPMKSGFDVLEWLREQPQFQQMPVVVFSSSGRAEDRMKARELGASAYLLKPVSGMQFVDTARELKQVWLPTSS